MIKAIETVYKGYRFRSRLEARWAVFFDALGIEWEYEPEGYDLDGVRYLPDFWLPTFDGGMFAEVKPKGGDFSKAKELCATTHAPVWRCEGVPDVRAYNIYEWNPIEKEVWVSIGIPNADAASDQNRMFSYPGYENKDLSISPFYYNCVGQLVIDAVEAARSARFEHGERPKF